MVKLRCSDIPSREKGAGKLVFQRPETWPSQPSPCAGRCCHSARIQVPRQGRDLATVSLCGKVLSRRGFARNRPSPSRRLGHGLIGLATVSWHEKVLSPRPTGTTCQGPTARNRLLAREGAVTDQLGSSRPGARSSQPSPGTRRCCHFRRRCSTCGQSEREEASRAQPARPQAEVFLQ
jgi:hypothetical protein